MLSERIDTARLRELAVQGLSGTMRLGLDRFPRLQALGIGGDAEGLKVSVAFSTDRQQRPRVGLQVAGRLELSCQRCLEPLSVPVAVDVLLTVLDEEAEAELLEDPFDSVLLVDGGLPLFATVEDELLSMVPLAPRHEDETCTSGAMDEELPGNRPFANLDDLLGAGQPE